LPEPSVAIEQEKREFKPCSEAARKAAWEAVHGVDVKTAAAGGDA